MMHTPTTDLHAMTEADIAPLEALFGDGSPVVWCEIAISLYTYLRAVEMPTSDPASLAAHAVGLTRQLTKDFGGNALYIPNGAKFDAKLTAAKIRLEFKGNNVRQLATKYGVSDVRVRQILGV